MEIRSRAPLRIGLAGGGTDLADYSSQFGGAVFNATVNMYSYCTISPNAGRKIHIIAPDRSESLSMDMTGQIPLAPPLILHRGVYNRIVRDFNHGQPLSFTMSTSSDAPAGSGLGTSSTMVVAILEAFNRLLGLGLDEYEKAALAYDIERHDLGLAGGRQDQYAAVFGGFNLMEFKTDCTSVMNRLRLDDRTFYELESSLLLFYYGKSRDSGKIIEQQIRNTKEAKPKTLEAMHHLKQAAYDMKDAVLTGDFVRFAQILRVGWEEKKKTSEIVTNKELEDTINFAFSSGAEAVKLSGAGGGGFVLVYCNPINRQKVSDALKGRGGVVLPVSFSKHGAVSWVM
jgi:D-glycero-alpha-D-manno-heptose-7-phosphate kinase